VVFAPLAVIGGDIGSGAWPYIAASAVLELAYLVLLSRAYASGELSVVYPVARGSGPVLVLVFGALVLGTTTSGAQVAGVLLVAAGVLALRGFSGHTPARDVLFGLAIGVTIAGYTLVDKEGLDHASTLAYLWAVICAPAVIYAAGLARVRGTAALREQVGARTVVAGVSMIAAYGLVLLALKRAPAASVAAVRETSILIATALAAVVLRERVTPLRALGAVAITGGIVVLALG
jgi:drug/metabolite transporter (DMT)-like permease